MVTSIFKYSNVKKKKLQSCKTVKIQPPGFITLNFTFENRPHVAEPLCAQDCIQIAKHGPARKTGWMALHRGRANSWSLSIHLPHKRGPTVSTSQIQPFIYNLYTSPQGQTDSFNYHQWPSRTWWKFLKIFSHGCVLDILFTIFWQINHRIGW